MILRVALLFFYGATISSSQFMPKLRPLHYETTAAPNAQPSGCPTSSEPAPLICKLIQQNVDLYFKPKLIKPSTYIPPINVEKCNTAQLQMDIELPAPVPEIKPLVIPQPPQFPPMTISQFPIPVIITEPPKSSEPFESTNPQILAVNNPLTPALSPMPIQTQIVEEPMPVEPETYYTPTEIPQAPELPVFTMPDLPVVVEPPQSKIPAPYPESTPKSSEPDMLAAPELSPKSLPDYPIYFDIPSGPVLSSIEVNFPEINNNSVEYVPHPPALPAFAVPGHPILEAEQEQSIVVEPCLEDKPAPALPIQKYIQPVVAIPQPPELPEFVMPDLTVVQDTEQKPPTVAEPCLEDKTASVFPIPDYFQSFPAIPRPPQLPEFVMPQFHVIQVNERKQPKVEEPFLEDNTAPVIPIREYIEPMIAIPQPPELQEFIIPELPVVQVTEQNQPTVAEPYLEDKPAPIIPIQEYIPPVMGIPQPPELQGFIMPELQVTEQKQPTIGEPYREDNSLPVMHVPESIQPVVSVPQAPELPPFSISELPVHVKEQNLPVVPAPSFEDLLKPILTLPGYIQSLPTIPTAPDLPPVNLPEFPIRLQVPTWPVVPPTHILSPPYQPYATEELMVPQHEPISIPKAPKLTEFIMPDFPIKMTITKPAMPQPTFINEPCESSGKPVIPVATVHKNNAYFENKYLSFFSVNNKKIKESHRFLVPSKPSVPQFIPPRGAYNLIMEHIIPNIASDRFRSLQNIDILPPSVSPRP